MGIPVLFDVAFRREMYRYIARSKLLAQCISLRSWLVWAIRFYLYQVAVYVHAFSFSTNSSLMGMNLYRSISYLLTFGHTSHWSVFTQSVDTLPFACSLFNQGIFDGNKLTRVVHAIRIHY